MDLKVYTLEENALYELINKVVSEVKQQFKAEAASPWIDGAEAMEMLKIKSPTTLAELRNEGRIRYSQPRHKILLYDKRSILEYIEKHAKEPFNK